MATCCYRPGIMLSCNQDFADENRRWPMKKIFEFDIQPDRVTSQKFFHSDSGRSRLKLCNDIVDNNVQVTYANCPDAPIGCFIREGYEFWVRFYPNVPGGVERWKNQKVAPTPDLTQAELDSTPYFQFKAAVLVGSRRYNANDRDGNQSTFVFEGLTELQEFQCNDACSSVATGAPLAPGVAPCPGQQPDVVFPGCTPVGGAAAATPPTLPGVVPGQTELHLYQASNVRYLWTWNGQAWEAALAP